MQKTLIMMALVLALVAGACAADVTESDEYRSLEDELAAVQQQLTDTEAELAAAQAEAVEAVQAGAVEAAASEAVLPDEVTALLDEWWAANERKDGSVADLYMPGGYHLYGSQMYTVGELADHFGAEGWTSELISGPYLIAAEPAGRYVVTEGVRNTFSGQSFASALTFELVTRGGELMIAETGWTHVTK